MSDIVGRLRGIASKATPAFTNGEPSRENYTESYAEQLAEFQLLFRPTTVLAMLDVIDAAETLINPSINERLRGYGVRAADLDVALAQFQKATTK